MSKINSLIMRWFTAKSTGGKSQSRIGFGMIDGNICMMLNQYMIYVYNPEDCPWGEGCMRYSDFNRDINYDKIMNVHSAYSAPLHFIDYGLAGTGIITKVYSTNDGHTVQIDADYLKYFEELPYDITLSTNDSRVPEKSGVIIRCLNKVVGFIFPIK